MSARETTQDTATMSRWAILGGASLAHFAHDGLTDLIYVLLPIWQKQFALDFTGLAMLRCLYYGTMGGLQVPADRWTRRFDGRHALVGATLVAAAGYALMSLPGGLAPLCLGLVAAGIGSSIQHPRASLIVSGAFGRDARRPLGLYNFAGDLGKAVFPPAVAVLLLLVAWRGATATVAMVATACAAATAIVLPRAGKAPAATGRDATAGEAVGTHLAGFRLLLLVGVLDTATRMGFLLFLPSLVQAKGGGETAVGLAFAAVFGGGAFGKAVCGWLGERYGVIPCVVATELATGALIAAVLACPAVLAFAALPLLGVVINGTSSVLYGTVPELAPSADVGRAFAVFYTAVIGSGALAPVLFGAIGDHLGRTGGVLASACAALGTIPAILVMRNVTRALS